MNRAEKKAEDKVYIFVDVTSKMMSKLHAYQRDLTHKHMNIDEHVIHEVTFKAREILKLLENHVMQKDIRED